MLTGLLPQAVTVTTRTAGAKDIYGNPSSTESTVTTTGRLRLLRTVEQLGDRDVVTTSWVIYLPPGTAISRSDAVVVDGRTFEVDGDPYPVYGRTSVHHLQVPLRVVEG